MQVIGGMAPISETRPPARRRWLMELLKLTGACAAGIGIASWLPEESPPPSSPHIAAPAVRPAVKTTPVSGSSKSLSVHIAAAARLTEALELARTDETALRRRPAGTTDERERRELIPS